MSDQDTLAGLLTSLHELLDTLDLPQREQAAARELVGRVVERVGDVTRLCGEAERQALSWSPELPVPGWARHIRSIVGGTPWRREEVRSRPRDGRSLRTRQEPVPVESRVVGELIDRAIEQRGVSNAAAARRTGYSASAVSSWSRGERRPTAEALLDFLHRLGYEPVVVLDGGYLAADASAGQALRRSGWTPPTT